MNGNDGQAAKFLIIDTTTGEEIAAFDSIPMATEVEYVQSVDLSSQKDISFINREFTGTLRNVEVEPDFIGRLLSGTRVDLVGWGIRLPRGKKMPKSKRLRKKWSKKYGEEFRFMDVLLEGEE